MLFVILTKLRKMKPWQFILILMMLFFKEDAKPINEDLNQVFKEDRLNGSNSSEASSSYFCSDFHNQNQTSIKTQPKNSQKTEACKFINFISKQSPTPCEMRPIDIQGMEQSSSSSCIRNNLMTPAKCNGENTYHEPKSERTKNSRPSVNAVDEGTESESYEDLESATNGELFKPPKDNDYFTVVYAQI
ncbi:unnamed protein product [Mytilus edulis]|uniref:Uncharacterized protein n=1 Tax=Mytilus edulis TaxID=6550 RepID=A0A8S3USD4_MYTED|nr:unnamed protein product [Mytilus edulis]